MSNQEIKTIDLFCGAGGSSYGAKKAGAKIVAGFDMWQPAVVTYEENFRDVVQKVYSDDIRELDPEKVKEEIGEIDLILGSSECTNHSRAKGNGKRSEESRRTAFEVTRFATVFKPKWIVVENVIEMRSWNGHQELRQELEELGYQVEKVILNSKDFGVPQSRKRLFLICALGEKPSVPTFEEQFPSVDKIINKNGRYPFTLLEKPGRAQKTFDTTKPVVETLVNSARFSINKISQSDEEMICQKINL